MLLFHCFPGASHALPLPQRSSLKNARTGPVKTGGRVFVLDHSRWTPSMKDAMDSLLEKHKGVKDYLKLVDQDYAGMVRRSASDPYSLLHPTTRLHISRYVKYTDKQLNTSSALNISQERVLDTQELWHSLTEGSGTTTVPVVTLEPAFPPPPPPPAPSLNDLYTVHLCVYMMFIVIVFVFFVCSIIQGQYSQVGFIVI